MSDAGDVIGDVSKQFNQKFSSVTVTAVLTNLGLYAALSFGIVLLFSFLRPRIRTVYEPKSKYSPDDKKPPKISSSFFAWISPIFGTKEDDMAEKLGLDAVAYLRYLRMMRYIFLCVAMLVCAVLLPCNLVYNFKNIPSDQRDVFGMLTIQNVEGNILFVHVAITYIIHLVAYYFIWKNSRRMVDLRWKFFRSKDYQNSLHARSIMITQVSKKDQSDERLQQLIASLQVPYPTTAVHVGRKVGDVPTLIEDHSETVKSFEQKLTTYIKRGANPNKRPKLSSGGCLGVGGEKKDAIDVYKSQLARLESQIWTARSQIDLRKPQSYGFASFARVPYAHMVAHKLSKKSVRGAEIMLAPQPKDIIWENLTKDAHARRSAAFFGTILLGFIMLIYFVPLAVVSAISNLASLTAYVPFLESWANKSEFTFSLVNGIAPPLMAVILQLILPIIIRRICRWQGAITRTRLDRAVFARLFFHLVISQLIVIALIGMVFSIVADIVNDDGNGKVVWNEIQALPQKIQRTYVQQSSYFLTWFPLRGFSAVFEIAQVISLLLNAFRTQIFGKTRRQREEWSQPPPMDYAVYAANAGLMVTVGMVYAPLAPLVAAAAAVAFFLSSWVNKYMLLYVFTTKVESGGRMWRQYVNRVIFALLFMQLLMCLTIALQTQYLKAIIAAPPIVALAIFKWYTNRAFSQKFRWYLPDNEEVATLPLFGSEDPMEAKTSEVNKAASKLAKRFGHPSLHQQLLRPYVYKSQESALATILGDVEVTKSNEKKGTEAIVAGGIKFTAFDDHAPDLTQEEYLRRQKQEDDWETGSIASTAVSSVGGAVAQENDYFNSRSRAAYMQRGPSALSGQPIESPYMSHDLTPDSIQSREDLLNNAAPPSFSPVYGRSAYGAGGPTDYAAVDAQSSEDLQGGTSMDGFSRFNGYYDDPTPPPTHSRYHSRNFSSNSFQSLNSQGAIAMSPPQNSGAYPPGPVPDYYRQGAPYDQSGSPSRLPPGAAGPGRNSPSQQNPYDGRRHYSRPSQDSLGRYH